MRITLFALTSNYITLRNLTAASSKGAYRPFFFGIL